MKDLLQNRTRNPKGACILILDTSQYVACHGKGDGVQSGPGGGGIAPKCPGGVQGITSRSPDRNKPEPERDRRPPAGSEDGARSEPGVQEKASRKSWGRGWGALPQPREEQLRLRLDSNETVLGRL